MLNYELKGGTIHAWSVKGRKYVYRAAPKLPQGFKDMFCKGFLADGLMLPIGTL